MALLDSTAPLPDDTAEPELSLADHEAEFVADKPSHTDDLRLHAEKVAKVAKDAVGDDSAPDRDARGKFVPRETPKHVAKSHRASAEDVPRIQELTRRLRETEAKYADLEKQRAAPGLALQPPVSPPTPDRTLRSQTGAPGRQAAMGIPQPEPKLTDFEDWDKYFDARTDWKIGEARRTEREENARVAAAQQLSGAWREKVTAAKDAYPDFEDVALRQDTQIPEGSLIDAWILEHKSGAHILYHLQKHPDELSRLLALNPFEQVDDLSQLALRLVPSRSPGVATGAPAARVLHPGPRPPTPVRTAPMRAADEPPGDDASLAQHEAYFNQGRSRRR